MTPQSRPTEASSTVDRTAPRTRPRWTLGEWLLLLAIAGVNGTVTGYVGAMFPVWPSTPPCWGFYAPVEPSPCCGGREAAGNDGLCPETAPFYPLSRSQTPRT